MLFKRIQIETPLPDIAITGPIAVEGEILITGKAQHIAVNAIADGVTFVTIDGQYESLDLQLPEQVPASVAYLNVNSFAAMPLQPRLGNWSSLSGVYFAYVPMPTLDLAEFPPQELYVLADACGITGINNIAGPTSHFSGLILTNNQLSKASCISLLQEAAFYYNPNGGTIDISGDGMPTFTAGEIETYVDPCTAVGWGVSVNQ